MVRKNYSKIEREYRTKLAEALWENKKLKQKVTQNSKLKQMVLHEIKNPLGNIINFSNLWKIREDEFSPEEIDELYELTGKEAKKVLNISEILYLDGCSREELKKCPEIFSLEKLALNYSHTANIDLINERVGMNLKYNKPFQKEMEIYFNKAVLETIWEH